MRSSFFPVLRAPSALTALLLLAPSDAAAGFEVRTSAGLYRGEGKNGARFFGAIAYAEPPVGARRWRRSPLARIARQAPRPVRCPQAGDDHFGATPLPESEDCLYLNVWAPPEPSREPWPVLLWIHGGGLVAGSGLEDFYDGSAFAKRGVVFVSFNYRLGELGYGPKLELEPGSLGLLDQATALRWVEKNISAFGGDPSRIFLMGHSKGAEAVTALMVSGLAGASVKGGIAMSFAAGFDRTSNGSIPPAQVKFYPGERGAPAKELMRKKMILVYVPELPAVREPGEPGPRYSLLASVLFNETFWKKDSEFYCVQAHDLRHFPPYLDAHFHVLHAGGTDHGAEVFSLFRQDAFGRALLDYYVSFLEEGRPPRRSLTRPAPFREGAKLSHFYRWFSLPATFREGWKGTDCVSRPGYENGRVGPFWTWLERALRVFGHGSGPEYWEITLRGKVPARSHVPAEKKEEKNE